MLMANKLFAELRDCQAQQITGGATMDLTADATGDTFTAITKFIQEKALPNGGFLLVGKATAVATGDSCTTSVGISASGDIAKTVAKSTPESAAICRSMGVGVAVDLPTG